MISFLYLCGWVLFVTSIALGRLGNIGKVSFDVAENYEEEEIGFCKEFLNNLDFIQGKCKRNEV